MRGTGNPDVGLFPHTRFQSCHCDGGQGINLRERCHRLCGGKFDCLDLFKWVNKQTIKNRAIIIYNYCTKAEEVPQTADFHLCRALREATAGNTSAFAAGFYWNAQKLDFM